MTTLVLFDVDGTLLANSGPTHLRAFAEALYELHGAPDPFEVDGEVLSCAGSPVNGLVDAQIMRLCLASAGVEADAEDLHELLDRFRTATVSAYQRLVADGHPTGSLLPGVLEVLHELEQRQVHVGLLTGNTEEICQVKMHHCGLGGRFGVGGYGGEVPDRAALFDQALLRAAVLGWEVDALCYVGDTPLDVDAARRGGVPLVAVCTGRYGAAELAGADAVLSGLDDQGAADALCAAARSWVR